MVAAAAAAAATAVDLSVHKNVNYLVVSIRFVSIRFVLFVFSILCYFSFPFVDYLLALDFMNVWNSSVCTRFNATKGKINHNCKCIRMCCGLV